MVKFAADANEEAGDCLCRAVKARFPCTHGVKAAETAEMGAANAEPRLFATEQTPQLTPPGLHCLQTPGLELEQIQTCRFRNEEETAEQVTPPSAGERLQRSAPQTADLHSNTQTLSSIPLIESSH